MVVVFCAREANTPGTSTQRTANSQLSRGTMKSSGSRRGAFVTTLASPFRRLFESGLRLQNKGRWTSTYALNTANKYFNSSSTSLGPATGCAKRSEEHTAELQSRLHLAC